MSQGRNLRETLRAVPGRVLGGFVIAIVTLIIASLLTVQTLSVRTSTARSVNRTIEVLRTTETLAGDVNDSQLALTEFIITGDPQFLEPVDASRRSMPGTLERLRQLTADHPEAQAQLDELTPFLQAAFEVDDKEIEARRSGASFDDLRPKIMEGKALLDRSAAILDRIKDDIGEVLDAEQRQHEDSVRHSTFVVIAGDLILLALVLAAAAVALRDAVEKDRAMQFQRRVLGMVGHDLRNPLSVVMMTATQLAKSSELNDRRQNSIARIIAAVSRMDRMIRDLFDYSRIELRLALPLDIRPADAHASCTRIIEELRAVHPTRAIEYQRGADARIDWDADRIEQVLENLLGNALKYSAPETPVHLGWRSERDGIVLEVKNGGTPIAADLLPHVFEPFRRGAHDARTSKSSMGLGLYIARHIVREHRGSIEVTSTAAEGTTFTVRIPQHPPTSTHAAA